MNRFDGVKVMVRFAFTTTLPNGCCPMAIAPNPSSRPVSLAKMFTVTGVFTQVEAWSSLATGR